jgi:hypothetical protein
MTVITQETDRNADRGRCQGCGRTGTVKKISSHFIDCPAYAELWQADSSDPLLQPHASWLHAQQAEAENDAPPAAEPEAITGEPVASTPYAEAKARAERIRQGLDSFNDTAADLAEAIRLNDYETLEYRNWSEYFQRERLDERIRSDGIRAALVATLRAAGLTQGKTGSLLGISQARVSQIERGVTGNEARTARRISRTHTSGGDGPAGTGDSSPADGPRADQPEYQDGTASAVSQPAMDGDPGPEDLPPASMGPPVLRQHQVHYRFAWEAFWWIAREVVTGKPRPEGRRADRVKIPEMPPWFPGRVEEVVTAMRVLQANGKPVRDADTHPAALLAELEQERAGHARTRAQIAELTAARAKDQGHHDRKHQDCPGPAFDF